MISYPLISQFTNEEETRSKISNQHSVGCIKLCQIHCISHTSEASGCTGALLAGPWKWRAGRPFGPPDASTPVAPECDGPWPHYWWCHQSALVAGSGTNAVQTGCLGIQSSPWQYTVLPQSTDPRWQLARTTTVLLYYYQTPRGTASQTVNSRQPSLCGCSSTHLEQTANWYLRSKFTVNLSSTTKTFLPHDAL